MSNIRVIENILSSPVNLVHTPYPVPAPPIFTYETASDPQSPSHDSSAEIVTPKVNPIPNNNPPNLAPNIPAEPDYGPSLSDSYHWIYLTHLTNSIINEDDMHKRIKINSRVELISITLL